MYCATTVRDIHSCVQQLKRAGKTIGFVPTMGALHEGHLSLIRRAREENDITVCSIFVNPIQFNNPQDLAAYPRTAEADCRLLTDVGCQYAFIPAVEEIYPDQSAGAHVSFKFEGLEAVMEGASRAGHFQGVALVVKRLFDIVTPDRAYFGEKDYQQLAIVQSMVRQLVIPVQIVPCPTVREIDGLAMSSRNSRLSADERKIAPVIYQSLSALKERMRQEPFPAARQNVLDDLARCNGLTVDYLEWADENTLASIEKEDTQRKTRLFIAVNLGKTRLIDNLAV